MAGAAPSSTYLTLDSNKLVDTIERLHRRIGERFPNAGLYGVAGQLLEVAEQSKARAAMVSRPLLWVRVLHTFLVAMIMVGIVGAVMAISTIDLTVDEFDFFEFIQVLEAGINDIVLIGAGIFFLGTLEVRVKRSRALKALNELRAIAHVIDMHQLTKDPEYVFHNWVDTPSSPVRTMTAYELGRYLDYCGEMLSLTGKLAALYVQNFDDSVVLSSVDEIESLTTALNGKIWQKLMILYENSPPNKEEHAMPKRS